MMIEQATHADTRRYARRHVSREEVRHAHKRISYREIRKSLGLSLSMTVDAPCALSPFATAGGFASVFPGAYVAYHADFGWDNSAHTWADLSGNKRTGTVQGAGTPALLRNAITSRNAISLATNAGIKFSLTLPAPGTQPFYIWAIWRHVSWAAPPSILFAGVTVVSPGLVTFSASPKVFQQNNVQSNLANSIIGSFALVEMVFTNSINDYIRIGSAAAVKGAISGNQATETTFAIGNNGANVGALLDVCAFVIGPGTAPPANARALAQTFWPGLAA